MFDDKGFEYKAKHLQIADKSGNRTRTKKLIQETTVKAKVSFEGISTNAKTISLFELQCSVQKSGYFKLEFRDIPLPR